MARFTQKLLGTLHRIFDKSPAADLALRIRYDGQMTWRIDDGVLTTRIAGGTGADLLIDLNGHTIASLADHVADQPGYTVPYRSFDLSERSALVLIDAEGDQAQSNGDHLYAYTSLLWAVLESMAWEIKGSKLAIAEMLKQMSIQTASGEWLADWGGRFGVDRFVGEADDSYAARIAAEALRIKANNVALESIIYEQTGYNAQVVDIDWQSEYIPTIPLTTNTLGSLTNQPGTVAAPAGNIWGPVPWGWLVKLGLTPVAPGVPPAGGYPYYGNAVNNNKLTCAFAVLIGVASAADLSDEARAKIKRVVDKYRQAGTMPLYFGTAQFLRTNTSGEHANTAGQVAGPAGGSYTQMTL